MNFVSIKLLWRDWRGGQLNLIVSALVLAVTVVTAVSLLADRVERGINEQISAFLAADLALTGGIEISHEFKNQASELSLQTADIAQFNSMVFAADNNHLASIKAVENTYPLRGVIELVDDVDATAVRLSQNGPVSGEVWIEPRLLGLLDIKVGDDIEVGYSKLKVAALIINEPDRGNGLAGSGARVLMNHDDLPATQLVRPGSRVNYRLLMSGPERRVQAYQSWYAQRWLIEGYEAESTRQGSYTQNQTLQNSGLDETVGQSVHPHYRLLTPQNAQQRLAEALQRGRGFLLLSGTIGVLLAGLAMALASHRYASRLTDQVALMKAWGQPSGAIRQSQLVRLSMIAAISTVLGMALGWLAHYFLLEVARGLFDAKLPLPGWRPWLVAGITGFVCVIGFALPALWHLPTIAPLKVLRRDLPDSLVGQGKRLTIGISALFGLTFWYSESVVLSLLFLFTLFSLFGVCSLIALQALKLVQRFGSWRGSYVRLGLANLWRRRGQTIVQLVGFSTTLMLLLVVTGVRTNLISEWEAQLPDDTPSHFLYNVSTAELEPIKSLLQENGAVTSDWFPMVRGRLVAINGELITPERMRQSEGLSREVNLTQTDVLPLENEIVEGTWWGKGETGVPEFSMEQEVANDIGVEVGDEIEFSIGGLPIKARLSSIRSLNWQSMTPNFYIIFNPGTLDRFSSNWVTSVIESDAAGSLQKAKAITDIENSVEAQSVVLPQAPFINAMVKQFPTAIVIQISDIFDRVKLIISRVTQGLEMILLLVLACGALVLFAAIGVSFDERLRENAILRTLGSSKKVVMGALAVEYAALGLIAGLIASIGAEIILYVVQTTLFNMQANWHPGLWVLGLGSGTLLVTTLGLLRSREIITVPPLQSLRQIA